MLRRFVPTAILIAAVMAQGCSTEHAQPVRLRNDVAELCHADPGPVVSVRADGRYALNFGVFDSAQLVTALHNFLAPRPDKLVMVQFDSARAAALQWVVPAINQAGGKAYKFDQACLHPAFVLDLSFR